MSWIKQVFSIEIRKAIAYRTDFWLQFIMSVFANVATAFFLWKAIFTYNNATTMRGYSFSGLMLYYFMVPVISRMINGPGLGMIAHEIYDGSLTRYLIYPISFFKYKYTQYLANTVIFFLQLVIGIILFALLFEIPADVILSPSSFFLGITAVLAAGLLAFSISTLLEMVAFWADNVWSLLIMVRFAVGLVGGAMVPIVFFPEKIQTILNYLPFRYLAAFPINCFIGKISFLQWQQGMLTILFWSLFCTTFAVIVWNRGKYKYTGVGI